MSRFYNDLLFFYAILQFIIRLDLFIKVQRPKSALHLDRHISLPSLSQPAQVLAWKLESIQPLWIPVYDMAQCAQPICP